MKETNKQAKNQRSLLQNVEKWIIIAKETKKERTIK